MSRQLTSAPQRSDCEAMRGPVGGRVVERWHRLSWKIDCIGPASRMWIRYRRVMTRPRMPQARVPRRALVWIVRGKGRRPSRQAAKDGKLDEGSRRAIAIPRRVMPWVEGNYHPPTVALDPQAFKTQHDTIFRAGECRRLRRILQCDRLTR
jgi:hypothetical protein